MFRRSNSSSNIPLLKVNLFGSKETKSRPRRSQSTSRLSQRDSIASTSKQRTSRISSLERKSSNLGLHRTTPKTGGKSPSLHRTTPASALSQRTNHLKNITPSSCHKERKTIQKLASDKKWVAEQHVKVQNFIISSSLFDLGIVNVNSLKPPTIKIFIYVTGILFKEISPKIKINNENYKEVTPAQLKVLQYPGTLSNSTLKTVNTLHSWPQVVGMWSWLIDRVNIGKCIEDEWFLESLEPEQQQTYLLKKNCGDHLVKRYEIFNTDEDDNDKIQEANEKYVNNLAEILGVDLEEHKRLKTEIMEKTEYKNKQITEIEQLKEQKQKVLSEIEQMKKEIADFYEADAVEEKDLDNELEIIQINLNDLRDAKADLKQSVNKLETAIKQQPCTYQEKQNMLRKIDQLKDEIIVKKDKIEHAQKIKNKFDHMLSSEIGKIQNKVIQWNRSLLELSIKKPELKKLLLREKGFPDPEFLNEIEDVLNHKIAIESEISKYLVKVENQLKVKVEKKQEIENEIKELYRIIDSTNQEFLEISENMDSIKNEIKNLTIDLEEKKKLHAQKIKEIQENIELKEQIKLMETLKKKRDNLNVEVNKFDKKMLSFFIEMHNQIINFIKEMDAIRKNVSKNFETRVSAMLEKQRQLAEALKLFIKENNC